MDKDANEARCMGFTAKKDLIVEIVQALMDENVEVVQGIAKLAKEGLKNDPTVRQELTDFSKKGCAFLILQTPRNAIRQSQETTPSSSSTLSTNTDRSSSLTPGKASSVPRPRPQKAVAKSGRENPIASSSKKPSKPSTIKKRKLDNEANATKNAAPAAKKRRVQTKIKPSKRWEPASEEESESKAGSDSESQSISDSESSSSDSSSDPERDSDPDSGPDPHGSPVRNRKIPRKQQQLVYCYSKTG